MNGVEAISGVTPGVREGTWARGQVRKEDFLRLLVTQLKYQDPLSPMKDTQFVAQLAQFGTLEGVRNLERLYEMGYASNLVGLRAAFRDPGSGAEVETRVTGFRPAAGGARLLTERGEFSLGHLLWAMVGGGGK